MHGGTIKLQKETAYCIVMLLTQPYNMRLDPMQFPYTCGFFLSAICGFFLQFAVSFCQPYVGPSKRRNEEIGNRNEEMEEWQETAQHRRLQISLNRLSLWTAQHRRFFMVAEKDTFAFSFLKSDFRVSYRIFTFHIGFSRLTSDFGVSYRIFASQIRFTHHFSKSYFHSSNRIFAFQNWNQITCDQKGAI